MLSHISFVSIPVLDPDRALAFYRDALEMSVVVDEPYGSMRWIMLAIADSPTQLHLDQVADMPDRTFTLPLIVSDLEATVARLRLSKATILADQKPADWKPGVEYALARDSEGNTVLLANG